MSLNQVATCHFELAHVFFVPLPFTSKRSFKQKSGFRYGCRLVGYGCGCNIFRKKSHLQTPCLSSMAKGIEIKQKAEQIPKSRNCNHLRWFRLCVFPLRSLTSVSFSREFWGYHFKVSKPERKTKTHEEGFLCPLLKGSRSWFMLLNKTPRN